VGTVGYLCFIFVQPHYRKKGIGSQLLDKALGYLSACHEVWAAKHFDTPFYGNRDGPFPPLYGSAEFVGLNAEDGETTRFFERRGFRLSHRSIEMECSLLDVPNREFKDLEEKYYFFSTKNIAPWDKVPYQKEGDFFVDFAVDHAGSLLGAVVWYPLGKELAGVYDVHIEQHWRDRQVGTWLFTKALEHMSKEKFLRAALVTTEFNNKAVHVYERVGFRPNKYYSNFVLEL
jgi:GNAT superfamily N-acetyltransferase